MVEIRFAPGLRPVLKHQSGKHDQSAHGNWAGGAREVKVSSVDEAWDAITTDEARSIFDREKAHPERYNPRGTPGYGLKDGEIETRVVRQDGPPRVRDYENPPAGVSISEAEEREGTLGVAQSGYMRPMVAVGPERPPQHVYRVMSTQEFDTARDRGYIKSDERMNLATGEGTVSSLRSTGGFYAPVDGSDYRVVRIRYDDADGWRTDLVDSYIKTDSRVPFDRVDVYSSPISTNVRKHQSGKHDQLTHGRRAGSMRDAADMWIGQTEKSPYAIVNQMRGTARVLSGAEDYYPKDDASGDATQVFDSTKALMLEIADAQPSDVPLYRGLAMQSYDESTDVALLKKGTEFEELIASWTPDKQIADGFATGEIGMGARFGPPPIAITLRVENLPSVKMMSHYSGDKSGVVGQADERVASGKYRVENVTLVEGEYLVDVSFRGLPFDPEVVRGSEYTGGTSVLGGESAIVRKSVEEGLAARMSLDVLDAVVKHQSGKHDQKTHGKWAGGSSDEEARRIIEDMITGVALTPWVDPKQLKASIAERITDRMSDVSTEDLISASGLGSSDRMNMNAFGQSLAEDQKDTIKLALTENDNIVVAFERDGTLVAYERGETPWEDIYSGPTDLLGRVGYPAGSGEAEKFVREWATSRMVKRWAETSNGQDERALALQEAAAREFKVKDASGWDVGNPRGVDAILEKDGATLQRFARAQYDETQSIFRDMGINEVELYRGKAITEDSGAGQAAIRGMGANGTDISVQTRPLSSWSLNADTAREFAWNSFTEGNFPGTKQAIAVLVRSTVPVSSILSTSASGIGSLSETEMVTIGSGFNSRIIALDNDFDEGFND